MCVRGSSPRTSSTPKHMSKTSKRYPESSTYIYLYFYGLALVSSGRDPDAPKRASENPNPKKRMLGPTPSISRTNQESPPPFPRRTRTQRS